MDEKKPSKWAIGRRSWILLRWGKELKRRHLVRQIWRGEDEHPADKHTISSLYESSLTENESRIDAQTWDDLELEDLFSRLNRTVSLPGAQVLYRHLRTGQFPQNQFTALHALIGELRANRCLRERLQMALLPLRYVQGDLARVLAGAWEPPPRYASWLGLYPYALVAMMTVSFFIPVVWLGVMAMMALSWILHLHLFASMTDKMPECTHLIRLLAVTKRIGKWRKTPIDGYLQPCRTHRSMAKRVVRRLWWFYMDPSQFDEVTGTMIRYGQIFFLKDVIAYHPLIERAVGNDFHADGRSLLITGSNMSGKTTFIKTVGVNLWLAQTLGLVCAKQFTAARFRIFSSIQGQEGLQGGKSYYYREIERILAFIKLDSGPEEYLFLIDEIFRGTNTAERLAASTAVLKELADKGLVMVTTHDIELEDRLAGPFRMVHFREEVQDGVHYFDYHLHDGPCRSRNAIRLLELVGYPDHLVQSALAELGT